MKAKWKVKQEQNDPNYELEFISNNTKIIFLLMIIFPKK